MKQYFLNIFIKSVLVITVVFFVLSESVFAEQSQKTPYFLKATKPGTTVYILGTMYGVSLNDLTCSDAIKKQVEQSDVVLLDWPTGVDKADIFKTFASPEMLKPPYHHGTIAIAKTLKPETREFLKQKGIAVDRLNYTSMFAGLTLFCSVEALDINLDEFVHMTLELEILVADKGVLRNLDAPDVYIQMESHGLYTPEDLEKLVANYSQCVEEKKVLRTHYMNGTVEDYLAGYNSDEEKKLWYQKTLYLGMLAGRLDHWMTQLQNAYRDHNSIFVAASVFPLIVPWHYTFIDMLRREGFSVEPVTQCE